MNYSQAIAYLLSLADFERSGRFAARPDLAPVRALLRRLGDPQLDRLTVHIAGSKGKGSTAAMIASMLREKGLRTGLYTSPHLHSFRERIDVNGKPISSEAFVRCVERLEPAVAEVKQQSPDRELVTFDLLTAMAFLAFREAGVDAQVIEAGLGGRLDSTNALDKKEVCVITPISLEHTAILGRTIAEIAAEKAGIIRGGSTTVTGFQPEEAATVIRRTCDDLGAGLIDVAADYTIERYGHTPEGQDFRLRTTGGTYDLHLPLLGRHQLENAATAVAAIETLAGHGVTVSPEEIKRGLAKVRWPGRLEVLRQQPLLVVDGAHNAESARRLRETLLQDFYFSKAILIVGVSQDKEIGEIAAELQPLGASVIATSARHPRAAAASMVAEAFWKRGISAGVAKTVLQAVEEALAQAGRDDLVCVLGSLFVAAEARAYVLGIKGDTSSG